MISRLYRWLDNHYNAYTFKLIKGFLNIYYPIYLLFKKRNSLNKESKTIISLTSFPARIKKVHLVIESILRQKKMPKSIFLYLSKEQFADKAELPKRLLQLENRGYLTILLVDDDLRPHKKYYYSFKNFNEYNILTIDDDIFYPESLISDLEKASDGKFISCLVANKITICDGVFSPYSKWPNIVSDSKPSLLNMPIGFGGVFYPRGCFILSSLLNKCKIKKYIDTDDLWLKYNGVISNTKVVVSSTYKHRVLSDVLIHNNRTLSTTNNGSFKNDEVISTLFFDIDFFCALERALEKE